jgi:uncharacterized protein (DUF488 family)
VHDVAVERLPLSRTVWINNKMKTSYFAINFDNPNAVSIALFPPKGFKGRRFPDLAPTKGLLFNFKHKVITEKEYVRIYIEEILDKLDPQQTYNKLGENAVLLCYERAGEFCHRRIVAEWFKIYLGIIVEEL